MIIFGRPIVSYLIGEISRHLTPLAFIYFVQYSTGKAWKSKVFPIIKILGWLNLIVPFALLFVMGIPLLKTTFLTVGLLIIVSVSVLDIVGVKWKNFNKLEYEEYPCLAVPILIVANAMECINFYFNDSYQTFMGIRIAIGVIFLFNRCDWEEV